MGFLRMSVAMGLPTRTGLAGIRFLGSVLVALFYVIFLTPVYFVVLCFSLALALNFGIGSSLWLAFVSSLFVFACQVAAMKAGIVLVSVIASVVTALDCKLLDWLCMRRFVIAIALSLGGSLALLADPLLREQTIDGIVGFEPFFALFAVALLMTGLLFPLGEMRAIQGRTR